MIKALNLTIYTTYRDFACDSADISSLPHDVADGSTGRLHRIPGVNMYFTKKRILGSRRNDRRRHSCGWGNI